MDDITCKIIDEPHVEGTKACDDTEPMSENAMPDPDAVEQIDTWKSSNICTSFAGNFTN